MILLNRRKHHVIGNHVIEIHVIRGTTVHVNFFHFQSLTFFMEYYYWSILINVYFCSICRIIFFLIFRFENTYSERGNPLLFNDDGTTWFVELVVFSWASIFLGFVILSLKIKEKVLSKHFFTYRIFVITTRAILQPIH